MSLIIEGEFSNIAYLSCAHEVKALIAQFQGIIEEEDKVLKDKEEHLRT